MGLFGSLFSRDEDHTPEPKSTPPGTGLTRWQPLARALVEYGVTSDADRIGALTAQYVHAVDHGMSVQERLNMLTALIQLGDQQRISANALMPFLFHDPEEQVISSAALAAAVLWPPAHPGALTGVTELTAFARRFSEDHDEIRAVGVLSGLLLLGDRRVTSSLTHCWRWLSMGGRQKLTHMNSGVVHAPVIEWLLDWLADSEQREYGAIAAALVRAAHVARRQGVVEVRRAMPSWSGNDGEPLQVLERWSFEAFGERIHPRLAEAARLESDPRIMPEVMAAWGLPRPAGANPSEANTPRNGSGVGVLARVPAEALADSLGFPAISVSEQECLQGGGDILLMWGIFNPYGPTICTVGRLRTEDETVQLLLYRMLNPFLQQTLVTGTLVGDDIDSLEVIGRRLVELFAQSHLATVDGDAVQLIAESAPSFVLATVPDLEPWLRRCCMVSASLRQIDLRAATDLIQRHPGRPWDRASGQRDALFAQLGQGREAVATPSAPSADPASDSVVTRWYETVAEAQHVAAELACLPGAWSGAIENCGSIPLQATAYDLSRVHSFLRAFEFPILEEFEDQVSDDA